MRIWMPRIFVRVLYVWQHSVVSRMPHFDSAVYRIDTEVCSCTGHAKSRPMIFVVSQRYFIIALHRLLETGLSVTMNNKQKRRWNRSWLKNSALCPHNVLMCFVWISEQIAIISLHSINWLVFITERGCVYCAVWPGYLLSITVFFVFEEARKLSKRGSQCVKNE